MSLSELADFPIQPGSPVAVFDRNTYCWAFSDRARTGEDRELFEREGADPHAGI